MPTQGCWGRRTPGQAALTLEVVPAGGTQRQHAILWEEPASAPPWDTPSPASLHPPAQGLHPAHSLLCPRSIPREHSERRPHKHPQDHPQEHPWEHPWAHPHEHPRYHPGGALGSPSHRGDSRAEAQLAVALVKDCGHRAASGRPGGPPPPPTRTHCIRSPCRRRPFGCCGRASTRRSGAAPRLP